jgi:hypothetical protein
MRRIVLGTALFLLGIAVGAFATDALHIWSRPMLATSLRTAIQTQEELLASRTAREGRVVESLVHRANAAASWSGEGFSALDHTFDDFADTRFLPIVLWAIHRQAERAYPNAKPEGRQCYGAVLWQQVALTLEALHLPEQAAAHHERAAANLPCGVAASSFAELVQSQSTETHIETETLVLRD